MGVFHRRRPISRKMSRPWNRELGWSLNISRFARNIWVLDNTFRCINKKMSLKRVRTISLFVAPFVTMSILWKNSYNYHHQTFNTDVKWVWHQAIKFARWQHPAVGSGVTCAVSGNTCFLVISVRIYNKCSTRHTTLWTGDISTFNVVIKHHPRYLQKTGLTNEFWYHRRNKQSEQ